MESSRRKFLVTGVGLTIGLSVFRKGFAMPTSPTPQADPKSFANQPDSFWKQKLTKEQFAVLRDHGTERAFTSPLNANKAAGIYTCAGCDLELFSSEHKFDSGTGWPSFWQPIAPEALGTTTDRKFFMKRTEVHCSRCEGHMGHVFDDGPKPTGLRYCINGVSLNFRAKS